MKQDHVPEMPDVPRLQTTKKLNSLVNIAVKMRVSQ